MSLECGRSVDVKRMDGARTVRFVANCAGRFLVVSNGWPPYPRNGYMLADWRGVARELVAMCVPVSMRDERGQSAESQAGGLYHDLWLTYPLSVKGMAELLGEDVEAVRELLSDLAVQAE